MKEQVSSNLLEISFYYLSMLEIVFKFNRWIIFSWRRIELIIYVFVMCKVFKFNFPINREVFEFNYFKMFWMTENCQKNWKMWKCLKTNQVLTHFFLLYHFIVTCIESHIISIFLQLYHSISYKKEKHVMVEYRSCCYYWIVSNFICCGYLLDW